MKNLYLVPLQKYLSTAAANLPKDYTSDVSLYDNLSLFLKENPINE